MSYRMSFNERPELVRHIPDDFGTIGFHEFTPFFVTRIGHSHYLAIYLENIVYQWCNDNLKGQPHFSYERTKYREIEADFVDENDAILFKLRWL